jgi:hypothetical protein
VPFADEKVAHLVQAATWVVQANAGEKQSLGRKAAAGQTRLSQEGMIHRFLSVSQDAFKGGFDSLLKAALW